MPVPTSTLLRMCVLGSGSGGNSTLVQSGQQCLLLDAGFGPRAISRRLAPLGIRITGVRAILLTHMDRDHFQPAWIKTCLEHRIPLFLHGWHQPLFEALEDAKALVDAGLLRIFGFEPLVPLPAGGMRFTPVPLPHDAKGTIGYRLDAPAGSIGFATDLGQVPPRLIEIFTAHGGVDLLAIESNYDPAMQQASSRPWFLKQRIMGGNGHLSNQQAFELASAIVYGSHPGKPARIVLLHRSRQCNGVEIIRRTFAQDPVMAARVVLTEQQWPTPWLNIAVASSPLQEQLELEWDARATCSPGPDGFSSQRHPGTHGN